VAQKIITFMSVFVRLKQEDARPDGRCDMRPSQLIKDYIRNFTF